jgi:hypothetical protein
MPEVAAHGGSSILISTAQGEKFKASATGFSPRLPKSFAP